MLFSTDGQQLFFDMLFSQLIRYAMQLCWTAVAQICYSALLDSSCLDIVFSTAGQQLFRYAIQHCWTAVVLLFSTAGQQLFRYAIQHCWTAVV